jgi:ribosomal protein S6--L-glutamate ligase
MTRLAVMTQAETFERMREPLADRGIEVVPVQAKERTLAVTGDDHGDPASSGGRQADLPDVDVGFVSPSRAMEGGVVDTLLSVPWVNDREAVLTSRNKAGVLAACAAADLPVPQTTMVSNPVDDATVAEALADFDAPVVVKPNSTTRGVGVVKVGDPDSALGVTDYLDLVHDYRATGDRSYLLQEYLPEARDYRAMVVDGDCVGGVERRLSAEAVEAGHWKHNVHRGAEAVGVNLPDRHRRLAESVAATLGIDYLGVDLLESSDRLVVSETNARPTIDSATKYDDGFWDRLAALIERTAER